MYIYYYQCYYYCSRSRNSPYIWCTRRRSDVLKHSSIDSTVNNNQYDFIVFDINHILQSPHNSMYGLHTSNVRPLDVDITDDEADVEQYVPFDPNRYSYGVKGSM